MKKNKDRYSYYEYKFVYWISLTLVTTGVLIYLQHLWAKMIYKYIKNIKIN
jgi:hypothetical protein